MEKKKNPMASKAHVVDGSVNERRLRPIYDWLDNGNNKKALQEADKVLRKMPKNQCARVLKALALLRLGKQDECLAIMDAVRAEVPCEDSTLQAMSICYKETYQPDKIRQVYEAAAESDPNNEELLTHLFMAYARLGDYKRQQRTAMALYKLKAKNPYYFWAVMSVVMQAVRAEDKLAKEIMLPLAERMVLKLVGEGKLEAEQEVQLYLMILELQGKNEEVLKVLHGPLATLLSSVAQRKALLLLQLGRYREAANDFRDLISGDVDNWAYYKDYLRCALEHQTPHECLRFLDEIASTCAERARAPRLARFELLKRVGPSALADRVDIIDLMSAYFEQFGAKVCVVSDLKLYLNLVTHEKRMELLDKIEKQVGVGPGNFPTSADQMRRHIHYEQLRRICGMHHAPHADTEKRRQLFEYFRNHYERGNESCPPAERLPTDFSPADPYVLLASHLSLQLWFETGDASHLYEAMALLERGLSRSPANFHLKILLVRIYLEAGLVGAADHAFGLLEAKQIQLDSLGYLHTPLLAPLGHLSRAATLLDHAAKFFVANYKQSADHLTFAYKYGSFVKIQEFVELKERLENSLHFATTTVDNMLLELSWSDSRANLSNALAQAEIQPHKDEIRWELLRDNRDLEVVIGWEPLDEENPDPWMREETRDCMLALLSARSLILRTVAACTESVSSSSSPITVASSLSSSTSSSSPSLLIELADRLEKLHELEAPRCLDKFAVIGDRSGSSKAESVLVPLDAYERLRESIASEQLSAVGRLAKSLARSSRPEPDCLEFLSSAKALETLVLPAIDAPVSYKRFLLRASTCGETIAVLTAMCVAFSSQSHQPDPNLNKRKSKKSGNSKIVATSGQQEPQTSRIWRETVALLADKIEKLEASLTDLEKHRVKTGLRTNDEATMSVIERAQDSVSQSCWILKTRLQRTASLLDALRS